MAHGRLGKLGTRTKSRSKTRRSCRSLTALCFGRIEPQPLNYEQEDHLHPLLSTSTFKTKDQNPNQCQAARVSPLFVRQPWTTDLSSATQPEIVPRTVHQVPYTMAVSTANIASVYDLDLHRSI